MTKRKFRPALYVLTLLESQADDDPEENREVSGLIGECTNSSYVTR